MDLLTALNGSGQSILMVTHDIRTAIRGTRILYLEGGKVLDEITLPSYQETDAKKHEKKLSDWLSALSW